MRILVGWDNPAEAETIELILNVDESTAAIFSDADQFEAAVSAFERADSAKRDARTQFYIAYAFYRRGWGRFYHDDAWFTKGLETVNRAIAVAPNGRIVVEDPTLQMHSGDELKAELEAGLRRDLSDLNPLRLFRGRK